jgi:PAS domain S-box-containing protein
LTPARVAALARFLTSRSNDLLWYVDAQGHVLTATGAFGSLLGVEAAALRRQPELWSEIVHPEDRDRVLDALLDPAKHLAQSNLAFRVNHVDGKSTHRLEVRFEPQRETDGKLLGVACIGRIESAAASGSALGSDQILGSIGDATVVFDAEGRATFVNDAARRLWGAGVSQWDDLSVWDLYATPIPVERREEQIALRDDADHAEGEYTLRESEGEHRLCFTSFSLLRGEDKQPVGLVAISRDVTRDKDVQRRMLQMQKLESVGTLAGGVAHDFNNLLGGILGFAQLIQAQADPDSKIREQAERIERSAQRAAHLTRQMLSFSRRAKYQLRVTTMNEVVQGALTLLEGSLPKSIILNTDLDPEPQRIEADLMQLEQVIVNLCINARDAVEGGGWITVRTRARELDAALCQERDGLRPGPHIELMVKDTGKGMDADTLAHVFEPFFTTKEVGRGTGLGLAVVHGIVKAHGGVIDVQSTPGAGTQFLITLPVTHKPLTVTEEAAPASVGSDEVVLVVDDEESLRAFIRDALESFGYRVLEAKDGIEAIEVFKRDGDSVGLVLLDMQMPGLGGRQTFRRLQEMNADLRVVLMSGHGRESEIDQCLAEGVLAFLEKPCRVQELTRVVREALDRAVTRP